MQKLFSTTYGPREGLIKRGRMDSKFSVISTSDTFRSFNYASKNHSVYLKLLESLCIPWKCILLLNRSRIQIQYQFSFTTIIAQISSQPFYYLFFHVSLMIRLTRFVTLMESILNEIWVFYSTPLVCCTLSSLCGHTQDSCEPLNLVFVVRIWY